MPVPAGMSALDDRQSRCWTTETWWRGGPGRQRIWRGSTPMTSTAAPCGPALRRSGRSRGDEATCQVLSVASSHGPPALAWPGVDHRNRRPAHLFRSLPARERRNSLGTVPTFLPVGCSVGSWFCVSAVGCLELGGAVIMQRGKPARISRSVYRICGQRLTREGLRAFLPWPTKDCRDGGPHGCPSRSVTSGRRVNVLSAGPGQVSAGSFEAIRQ